MRYLCTVMLTLFLCGCVSTPKEINVLDNVKTEIVKTASSTIVPTIVPTVSNEHTLIYSYAGVGLFVLGALVSAFWKKENGLVLILCGISSGAVPYVVTSSYFAWISAGTLVCIAGIGIWYLQWKAIHEAKEEEKEDSLCQEKAK